MTTDFETESLAFSNYSAVSWKFRLEGVDILEYMLKEGRIVERGIFETLFIFCIPFGQQ